LIQCKVFVSENLHHQSKGNFIDHPLVGKYFQEFKEHYFVPNDEKANEYPDDLHLVEQLNQKSQENIRNINWNIFNSDKPSSSKT